MLSSLKEKLLHVNLFTGLESKTTDAKKTVDLDAGGEILQQFQKHWEEIHDTNVENASQADKVAKNIALITDKINKHNENISLITHILSTSNLATNIKSCLNSINDLYEKSESIESDLIKLENIIDDVEFENLKKRHSYHLSQYEQRKKESLESFKSALDEAHIKKIAQFEASKRLIQEERQKVFQDAFKTDLELYKTSGTIPENSSRKPQNSALLEEIQLDFNQEELDQFFNDNN